MPMQKRNISRWIYTITFFVFLLGWMPAASALDYTQDGDADGADLFELATQVAGQAAGPSQIQDFAAVFGHMVSADPIVRVVIREKAGQDSTHLPVTFGHVFQKGDAPEAVAVSVNGTVLPTQCDVKRRYDDGSVRHAVISVVLPALTAHQDLELWLVPAPVDAAGGALSRADILATDIQSRILLSDLEGSGYSGDLTADLRDVLADQAELVYWLQGPVCTEIIVQKQLNNSLNALWEVRFYPGTEYGYRISNTIENVEADYRGNIDYAVDIALGHADPQIVYHKDKFRHNQSARWRKVLWQGESPPEVEIRYDIDYLIASGHIPNYDTNLKIPEATLQDAYDTWAASDHDIMGTALIQTYFPTTGDRQEIGILPRWAVRYLLSMDNRLREVMLNLGELSGSMPIHMRESDPTRSFFGRIVSIDDRPTLILDRTDFEWTDEADRLAEPIGETDTEWYVDRAHQTSFAYVPYLITGEYYYLHEMYCWSGWDIGAGSYNPDWGRNYDQGLIRDQVRGEAWAIRVMAQAAALGPEGDPEQAYIQEKLDNNIIQWELETVANPDAHPLHTWGYVSCRGQDGGRPTDAIIGCESPDQTGAGSGVNEDVLPIRHTSLPWQDDFMVISLRHLLDLGYPTQELLTWLGEFTIDRFTHPDYNPYNGAPYKLPATYTEHVDDLSPYDDVASWYQANQAMIEQLTAFSAGQSMTSYPYKARAALACLADLMPDALATFEWLDSQLDNQELLNEEPTWGLVPRMEGQ